MSKADSSKKKNPGNQTWAIGSRKPFFESQEADWKAHSDAKKYSTFYTFITQMYHIKYHSIAPTADLIIPNTDMPTDEEVNAWNATHKEEEKGLTVDELAIKQAGDQEEFSNLRRVHVQKHYLMVQLVLQGFAHAIKATIQQGKKPHHARFLNAYSKMFYPSKIKPVIDATFTQSTDQSEKACFTLTNCMIKEHWDQESLLVKTMIQNKIKAQYQDAMAKYKKLQAGPTDKSPEDYHLALIQESNFVQVIVNSLRECFGMQVCIMLVGPIGENRGTVEVQSVHSSTAMGLDWPELDKKGFAMVEKSFLHFGLKSFSEEDRNAKALKGMIISKEDAILAPITPLHPLQLVKTAPASDLGDRSPLLLSSSEALKASTAKSPFPSLSNKTVEPPTEKSSLSGEALKSSIDSPPVPASSPSVVSIISSKDKTVDAPKIHPPLLPHSTLQQQLPHHSDCQPIDNTTFGHSNSPSPAQDKDHSIDDMMLRCSGSPSPPRDKGCSINIAPFKLTNSLLPTRNDFAVYETVDGDSGVSGPSLEVDLLNEQEKSSMLIHPKDVEAAWNATNHDKWYPELISAFDRFHHGTLWDLLWSRAMDSLLVFEW
ncbi:hypothetical protein ARMGADRAFT_1038042 [Armillaria gallica]|uniref:Uncharacterized protein n=1 Tax=Armillaria gallica TaxID=47427 RepID=A0A2H3D6Y3_ARMGA|nr:hypothetical protein ARMGADRAFT_1038042 [Armillaria gallica]